MFLLQCIHSLSLLSGILVSFSVQRVLQGVDIIFVLAAKFIKLCSMCLSLSLVLSLCFIQLRLNTDKKRFFF